MNPSPGKGTGGYLPKYVPGPARTSSISSSQASQISDKQSSGAVASGLSMIAEKLNSIGEMAKEKGTLMINETELRVLTKAINNENFTMKEMGV